MKRKVLALACTLALSAGLLAGCGSSTHQIRQQKKSEVGKIR